jgi:hypothetical protein
MTIRSVGHALSWEYWRRGMVWFVPAVVALAVGCSVWRVCFSPGTLRWADVGANLREALVPFLLWMPVILALASWTALRRHYALPVRTASLVAWSLANGALATAGVYCCTALTFRVGLHADWPLAIPALCAAAVYVAYQATLWWLGQSRGLLAVLAVVVCASLAAVGKLCEGRLPVFDRMEMPHEWGQVSGLSVAVWVGGVALSWLVAVNGVARDRRGAAWSFAGLSRGWAAATDAVSRRRGSPAGSGFRSAASAQFWYEWRTRGRPLPLMVAGMLGGLWLCFALLRQEPYEISIVLGAFTALFVGLSPLLGVFLGSHANGFDLKSFRATRPLPDGGLAAAVLRSAAAGLGSSDVIWLAGCIAALALWVPEDWQRLCRFWNEGLVTLHRNYGWGTTLLALASWTLVGLGASLALAGQRFVCWGGLGVGGFLLTLFFTLDRVPADVAKVLVVLAADACLGGTIAAFVVARYRRLLSGRAVLACLAGYLVLLVYFYCGSPPVDESAFTHSLRIGFGAAPFAPMALAPLALSWNRHR